MDKVWTDYAACYDQRKSEDDAVLDTSSSMDDLLTLFISTMGMDWTKAHYFNFWDMNRIERNIEDIVSILGSYSTHLSLVIVKNRDNTSFDFFDSLNRIEGNLLAIKDVSYEPVGWVQPKTAWQSMDGFGYMDAVRIDRNTLLLYTLIKNAASYLQYPGMFTCGQDNTYL